MYKFFSLFDKGDVYVIVFAVVLSLLIFKIRSQGPFNWDHFWQNLDKFLVTFLFLFVFIVCIKQSSQVWVQDIVKQLLSAVLALLGARAFQSRSADTNRSADTVPKLPPATDDAATPTPTQPQTGI